MNKFNASLISTYVLEEFIAHPGNYLFDENEWCEIAAELNHRENEEFRAENR